VKKSTLGIALARVATLAAFGLVAATIAGHWRAETLSAPAATQAAPAYPPGPTTTPIELAEVATWHLFGEPPHPDAANGTPETTLGLTLTGIVFVGTEHAGSAIIASSDGSQKPYVVGDTLPGGAVLAAVLHRKVIIELAGRRESLSLPKLDEATAAESVSVEIGTPQLSYQGAAE
jgi:general secretion pathway protein C